MTASAADRAFRDSRAVLVADFDLFRGTCPHPLAPSPLRGEGEYDHPIRTRFLFASVPHDDFAQSAFRDSRAVFVAEFDLLRGIFPHPLAPSPLRGEGEYVHPIRARFLFARFPT